MICAIDPGKYKIGFVVTDDDRTLIFSAIIPQKHEKNLIDAIIQKNTSCIETWLQEGKNTEILVDKVYLGNGTTHKELLAKLSRIIDVFVVDEKNTTLEGRKIYWELHPPKGLWKLIPTKLIVPPRDIDDLAAYSILKKSR